MKCKRDEKKTTRANCGGGREDVAPNDNHNDANSGHRSNSSSSTSISWQKTEIKATRNAE